MDQKSKVAITLTQEEAVVFFDWISRLSESTEFKQTIEDEAEATVVNRIVCDLESNLAEPFAKNYKDILIRFRKQIKGE